MTRKLLLPVVLLALAMTAVAQSTVQGTLFDNTVATNSAELAIGTSAYDLPALGTVLRKSRDAYVDQGVIIRGDASLNYQDLADVLSVCDAAGIRNVRLPVRPRDGDRCSLLPCRHPVCSRASNRLSCSP